MKHQDYPESLIKRTSSGAIDYGFYDKRAREIRGNTILRMLKQLLSGKKFSCEVKKGKVNNQKLA